jgi:hypothetical protein
MSWGKHQVLTAEQVEYAKYLRKNGSGRRPVMCPRRIAKVIGVGEGAVRRALGLETASCGMLRERTAHYAVKFKEPVPLAVLIERERAMNEERSLGAVAFGDPPFSRSALGRRNGEARQETKNGKARTQWEDAARAWHRPKRSGGHITAPNGGRLLARLAQGDPCR